MHLYLITTHFWGKDLDEGAILAYIAAKSDDDVYNYIKNKHAWSWPDKDDENNALGTRKEIIEAKGDFDTEYMGEFYDQKFGWNNLGPITAEDVARLTSLKIIR